MKDFYGREIDYMRISITDRCNLRCIYCMPDGARWIPMRNILTYEEILRVCREAVSLGIRKFKITGGEPLVRKNCVYLIHQLSHMQGVRQVTMTTNGILLKDKIEQLEQAGLAGINISIDTLDPEKYRKITGYSGLASVLESIRGAADTAMKVKLNCVLQKGVNEEEWYDLTQMAKHQNIDVRFIEMMPIGAGRGREGISNEWILNEMKNIYPDMVRDERIHGNGPAVYYKIPCFLGSVGFISAIHGKFCHHCNRIRMSADGGLKPCLCYGKSLSVKQAVRAGDSKRIRDILYKAVALKPEQHCFEQEDQVTEVKKMVQIGG